MLVGTHALLPVCGCLVAGRVFARSGRAFFASRGSLWAVGFFGVLPDLCTPHFSLAARQTSWSHSVWFLLGLIPVVVLVGRWLEGANWRRLAVLCWVAAALHFAADAVSGGIAWLYPWRPDVIGMYFIPATTWIWYDAFFILFAWGMVRVLPKRDALRLRRRAVEEKITQAIKR